MPAGVYPFLIWGGHDELRYSLRGRARERVKFTDLTAKGRKKVFFLREKLQILPLLFWIALSVLVMALSWRLGLKDQAGQEGVWGPGPGLMPFLASGILFLVSLGLLARGLLKRKPERAKPCSKVNYGKTILVLAAIFAYAFLLERLGYLVMTFLLLGPLFWKMGTKWNYALIASAGTALLTYFLFTYLGLLFPEGILTLGVGR